MKGVLLWKMSYEKICRAAAPVTMSKKCNSLHKSQDNLDILSRDTASPIIALHLVMRVTPQNFPSLRVLLLKSPFRCTCDRLSPSLINAIFTP